MRLIEARGLEALTIQRLARELEPLTIQRLARELQAHALQARRPGSRCP